MKVSKPFGPYERAAFRLDDQVQEVVNGRIGKVYAFVAWVPPVLQYGVLFDNNSSELFSETELLLRKRSEPATGLAQGDANAAATIAGSGEH